MASNRSKSMRLSDCTNIIYSRSNLGLDSSLSKNWSVENETFLSENSEISVGNLGNPKSFIDKVKQTLNKSELSIYFPRGSLNDRRLKRKKRETNASVSKLSESTEESPITSTTVSKYDSPTKTPCPKRTCTVDFTFGQSSSGSITNCLDSVAFNSKTLDRTELLEKQRKKLSVHFKCDSPTSPDSTNIEVSSGKQNESHEQNSASNSNILIKSESLDLIATNVSAEGAGTNELLTVKEKEPLELKLKNSYEENINEKETSKMKMKHLRRKRKSVVFGLDISHPSIVSDSLASTNSFETFSKNTEVSHLSEESCNRQAKLTKTLKYGIQNGLNKEGINSTYTLETQESSIRCAPMEEDSILQSLQSNQIKVSKASHEMDIQGTLADEINCVPTVSHTSPLEVVNTKSTLDGVEKASKSLCASMSSSKDCVNSTYTLGTENCDLRCAPNEEDPIPQRRQSNQGIVSKSVSTHEVDIQGTLADEEKCAPTESHMYPLDEVNTKSTLDGVNKASKFLCASVSSKDSVNSTYTLGAQNCDLRCAPEEKDLVLYYSRAHCSESENSTKLSLVPPIPPIDHSHLSIPLRQSDVTSISNSIVEKCAEEFNSISEKSINTPTESPTITNEIAIQGSNSNKESCEITGSHLFPLVELNNKSTFEETNMIKHPHDFQSSKASGITSTSEISQKLVGNISTLKENVTESVDKIISHTSKEEVNSKNETTEVDKTIEKNNEANVTLAESTLIEKPNQGDVLIESNSIDEYRSIIENHTELIDAVQSNKEEMNDLDKELTKLPSEPQLSDYKIQHKKRKSVTFANTARVKSDSQSGEISISTSPVPKAAKNQCSVVSQVDNNELGPSVLAGVSSTPCEVDDLYKNKENANGTSPGSEANSNSKEKEPECTEKNNDQNFICPEPPSLKRNSSRIEQNRSRKSSEGNRSLKQRRTCDKTINELSYDTISDVSEIPIDKTIVERKKIYHSTPKYSVIEKHGSSDQSSRRSLRVKKACKDQIIQVSKSIFGTSSEVTTTKIKTTNELSTSYSYQQETAKKKSSSKSDSLKKLKSLSCSSSEKPYLSPETGSFSNKYYSSSDGNKASNEESSTFHFIPSKNMLTTLIPSNESSIYSPSLQSPSKKTVCFKDYSTHIEYTNETSISQPQYSSALHTSQSFSLGIRSSVTSYSREGIYSRNTSLTSYSHEEMDSRNVSKSREENRRKRHTITSNEEEDTSLRKRDESPPRQDPTPLESCSRLTSSSGLIDSKMSRSVAPRTNASNAISEYSIATPLLKQMLPTQYQLINVGKNVKTKVTNDFKPSKNLVRYDYRNDKRFMIDYKPHESPATKFPAKWIHSELFKYIYSKLIENCDPLRGNVIAHKILSHICAIVAAVDKLDDQIDIDYYSNIFKHLVSKYNICSDVWGFITIIRRFTPYSFQRKVLSLRGKLVQCKMGDPIVVESDEELAPLCI